MQIEKFDEISSIDDDDDWFTIKQLHDTSVNDDSISFINDQSLPLTNVFSNNCYLSRMKFNG